MRKLKSTKRLWETVRHLKAKQFAYRAYYKFSSNAVSLQLPELMMRPQESSWIQPIAKPPSLDGETATFLNDSRNFSSSSIWNDPSIEKLWLYNLHYFDDLNATDANGKIGYHENLITRWMNENPPFIGNGWEPYPLSLRIVNWIKWLLSNEAIPHSNTNAASFRDLIAESRDPMIKPQDDAKIRSLYLQARTLRKKLEYHLLGNHLFANGKALIFAGCFFATPEANEWLQKGIAIIASETKEQILKDGGHFERSPMYHAIILEDILDIINCMQVFHIDIPAVLKSSVELMLKWLRLMLHPDGNIALLNDAAFNIAASYEELLSYAKRLNLIDNNFIATNTTCLLEDSGYAKLIRGELSLIADVGEIGPTYLPGHAHADTLSFELSYKQQRIVVDSGTSCYGLSEERLRQRSSAAHNVITIDNKNSSDVWGGFRVGKRASIIQRQLIDNDEQLMLSATHNGFTPLQHKRTWSIGQSSLMIEDNIIGSGIHGIAWHMHFHPVIKLIKENDCSFNIFHEDNLIGKCELDPQLETKLVNSTYHPEFGISIPNIKLLSIAKLKTPVKLTTKITFF